MRRHLITIFLIISLLLSSCQPAAASPSSDISFTEFTEEIFRDWVSSDSLTLNYTLNEPSNYKITQFPQGFFTSDSADDSPYFQTENLLNRLRGYKKEDLSKQEQILYDTLDDYLSQELAGAIYSNYTNILDPSSGIQAQLPVLLAEFHLLSEEDIDQYFSLLQSVPAYFRLLLQMEQEKKTAGTLPSRATLQNVIDQCESFLSENGCQMITTCFNKQTQLHFPKEAEALRQKHETYLQGSLIPAYKELITGLTALLPDAPSDGALASYANGKQYYAYLFRQKTGSSDPVETWKTKLLHLLKQTEDDLLSCAMEDPSALRTSESYQKKYSSPEVILDTLQEQMSVDFPPCPSTSYQLHNVDSSLEDYLSPAFYLTPPLDDKTNNAIYINNSPRYSQSSLFNTLAHEAYPGHLYQNCYLRGQKLPLLRYLIDYIGYSEGYATYAEIYSYRYTGASDIEVRILQDNAVAIHCIYALCDIGIHYEHWDDEMLSSFLSEHGIIGSDNVLRIYENIIDSPGSYLPYTIGYMQIRELRQSFSSDKEFHTYLLNMGPTSFSILWKYIKDN